MRYPLMTHTYTHRIRPYLILVLGVLACLPLHATYITIKTQVDTSVRDNQATITVLTTNAGDEAGYDCRVTIEAFGESYRLPKIDTLDVNRPYMNRVSIDCTEQKPGRHGVTVLTQYRDANQYPFSAISIGYLKLGATSASPVMGKLSISQSGTVSWANVKVRNLTKAVQRATVKIVVPDELRCATPEQIVDLEPSAMETLQYKITNENGLVGSAYQVCALIVVDRLEYLYTDTAYGTISIAKPMQGHVLRYTLIAGLSVIAVIVLVANLFALFRSRVDS